jgi:hypothetical protein
MSVKRYELNNSSDCLFLCELLSRNILLLQLYNCKSLYNIYLKC